MRALAFALGLAALVVACGGGSGPSPQPAVATISTIAPPASPADLEVARVNGRPVWGSCVAGQNARGAATRAAALDQCVAFELLAQAAEAKGLAADAEVAEKTRQALVNRVIELGFEQRYTKPDDLGELMNKWIETNAWRMHRPDLRASSYARAEVKKGSPPATDAAAHALADKIAAALASETGLFGVNLTEIATKVAAGSGFKLDIQDVPPTPQKNLDPAYGTGLYGIPEVGRASGAVRSSWGWDVVVWTGGVPAREFTREEFAAEAYPDLRRQMFAIWVNQLIKELHVHIELDQAEIAKLAEGSS